MSIDDECRSAGEQPSPAARSGRRRVQAAAGVLSLAILGGGAYLLAGCAGEDKTSSAIGAASPAPSESAIATDESPAAQPSAVRPPSSVAPRRTTRATVPAPAASSVTASSAPGMAAADAVETRTQAMPNGTIHVTSARTDLAGKREQLLAADNGTPVGEARCTQTLKVIGGRPQKIPNMMLCWHTSPTRSVLTLQVTTSGSPSAGASVKVLDQAWAALG